MAFPNARPSQKRGATAGSSFARLFHSVEFHDQRGLAQIPEFAEDGSIHKRGLHCLLDSVGTVDGAKT